MSFNGATFSSTTTSFSGATFTSQTTSFDGVTFSSAETSFGGMTFTGQTTAETALAMRTSGVPTSRIGGQCRHVHLCRMPHDNPQRPGASLLHLADGFIDFARTVSVAALVVLPGPNPRGGQDGRCSHMYTGQGHRHATAPPWLHWQ
jgi:hypothetical protein